MRVTSLGGSRWASTFALQAPSFLFYIETTIFCFIASCSGSNHGAQKAIYSRALAASCRRVSREGEEGEPVHQVLYVPSCILQNAYCLLGVHMCSFSAPFAGTLASRSSMTSTQMRNLRRRRGSVSNGVFRLLGMLSGRS